MVFPATAPYFRNIPATLKIQDTAVVSGGYVLLSNLTYSDLDPDDIGGLTVTMAPEWEDLFRLSNTGRQIYADPVK